jgi:sugar phosphate isomerase/epimerase
MARTGRMVTSHRWFMPGRRVQVQLSLFSVSYAGLWGQASLDLPSFIAKAGSLGFDSVMLAGKRPHASPLDMDRPHRDRLRRALEENQVQCAAIAGYTDLVSPGAAEVPLREMQIAYVDSLAQMASDLGASVVRIFTTYEQSGQNPHAVWNIVVRTIQEMCDRAANHGVTMAIQNHHDVAVDTEALLELLHDIDRPNCRVGFDAWSPALRGEDLFDVAKRMAPHTAMTTNADYVRFPRHRYIPELVNYRREKPDLVRAVPFGEGFIDYPAFFRGLKEGGFDGIASYEICSPIRGGGNEQNLDFCSRRYLEWMRDQFPELSRE